MNMFTGQEIKEGKTNGRWRAVCFMWLVVVICLLKESVLYTPEIRYDTRKHLGLLALHQKRNNMHNGTYREEERSRGFFVFLFSPDLESRTVVLAQKYISSNCTKLHVYKCIWLLKQKPLLLYMFTTEIYIILFGRVKVLQRRWRLMRVFVQFFTSHYFSPHDSPLAV